jgi:threonylcarbamoyladenosine tRNA methylthiotransferase MtaB
MHNLKLKEKCLLTVFFVTFGCKVNLYETECLKKIFGENGFLLSDTPDNADVIVINSCTVTSASDKKVKQTLRKMRRKNPEAVIALCGCYPQAFPDEAIKSIPADVITGTKNRSRLVYHVLDALKHRHRITDIENYEKKESFERMSCNSFTTRTRAFVKIQDGCNCFCSYCIIPYSRGPVRSRPLDELTSEITELTAKGYREIVLVGINLAFYGAEYGLCLTDAIEAISRIDGVLRIRLGSLEPEKITEHDLIRMASVKEFCPQFHLSLQSGCDRTLRAMNRKYTSDEYARLVGDIRRIFPEASITTDIMIGFPGETDEDFEESISFVEKIAFSKIHVFPYSVRAGTKAAKMENQVTASVKTERAARMTTLGEKLEEKFLKDQIGKTVPVLFEKENCTDFHRGYSPNYTLVKIKRTSTIKSLRNSVFYVNIKEAMNDFCIGEISE